LKHYEHTVVIDGSLDNDQINVEVKKVEDLIRGLKANISDVNRWGRRKMVYPIHKRTQGYYVIFRFEAEGSSIVQLEHELRLNEAILRFLTIAIEEELAAEKSEKASGDSASS
jgi:small subunit ribosomal protein S6